jgi:crotonobetainyl-CoA:carnitine CoA-transferase CaiB-like acyl-CoA transferase
VEGIPDLSTQFVAQNASKQSITLDLQTAQGRAIALELIASVDVIVENFSAGVADRLGIGYDAARTKRADIVYCAISGYGQDGPMARRPAYDHVIQAASGITMLTGTAESVPNRIGPPLFDYLAGMYGAFAVLAALRERDRTGQSQMVDVAMLDAAIVAMASTVSMLRNGGVAPKANGKRQPRFGDLRDT